MARADWDLERQPWKRTREIEYWRCSNWEDGEAFLETKKDLLFFHAEPIIESLRKKAMESLKEERVGSPGHADHKGFLEVLKAIEADTEDAFIKLSLLARGFPAPSAEHWRIYPSEYLKDYTKPILAALRTAFNIQKTSDKKHGHFLFTPDNDAVEVGIVDGNIAADAADAIQALIASYEREAEALRKKKHVPGQVRQPFELRWLMADLLSIVKPLAINMKDAKRWTRRIAWAIYEAAGGGTGAMPSRWADPELDYAVTVNKHVKMARGR